MDCPFSVPMSIIGKHQKKYLHMEVGVNVLPIVILNLFLVTQTLYSVTGIWLLNVYYLLKILMIMLNRITSEYKK